jgi:hypothetical protein
VNGVGVCCVNVPSPTTNCTTPPHNNANTRQTHTHTQGEKCDPHVYYHRVRLPMSGWKGNPRLPNGLVYESSCAGDAGAPVELYGETGAQSSIVAAVDAALGIEHECGW